MSAENPGLGAVEEYLDRHRERGLRIVSGEALNGWASADPAEITAASATTLDISAQR